MSEAKKLVKELKGIKNNIDGKPYLVDIDKILYTSDRAELLQIIQELLAKE